MTKKEIIANLINGSESAIKDYLDQGGDPNLRDERGHPILTASILFDRRDIALALLVAGADTNTIDETGRSVFYTSCAKSCYDVFQALGPERQDVNDRVPEYGFTPLMGACSNPLRYNEETLAVEEESFQIAKRLIELGADVSARDSDGETALHRAAKRKSDKCTKLLLENGAEIDAIASNLETPLSSAAFAGSEANVKVLLEKGANPNQMLKDGYTPLAWAASNGHEECVDILISHGGKILDNNGFTVKGFLEYLKKEKGRSSIVAKLEHFKSGCFIATAAFEDQLSPEVIFLRQYRDCILNKSHKARIFIQAYYLVSPSIARLISASTVLKRVTRELFLKPLIKRLSYIYPALTLTK